MSSKIRLLLLCPNNEVLNGSRVIAALCKMVQRNVYNLQLPEGWPTLKTQDKLKFLAKSMPKDYELVMLREPKWTRRNKSLYQKVLRGETGKGVFARTIPQTVNMPASTTVTSNRRELEWVMGNSEAVGLDGPIPPQQRVHRVLDEDDAIAARQANSLNPAEQVRMPFPLEARTPPPRIRRVVARPIPARPIED